MALLQGQQVQHAGHSSRHRSVSPISRCVSAPIRAGTSISSSSSNACHSCSSSVQARGSSRRHCCVCHAGQHVPAPGFGSSNINNRPPRSRTPPPRAVAVPLDQQVLNPDTDFSLDLVKCQFKCQFATNFGQELRIVGGAPELGAWDVAQAPAMTWNTGHVWMMNAFLPPGTYPFKIVVYSPGQRPESARWENGPNRSISIAANSPELGSAALVLVECQFDQTQHTDTQTKRITNIGFKATSIKGNPHTSSNPNNAGGAPLPSAHAMASKGSSDSTLRASMMAAAGIPTSKVTADARSVTVQQPHQQHQHQHQVQQQQRPQPPQQQQQQHPAAAAAAAAPAAASTSTSGAAYVPGTEAFNHRIADLDNRLAALLHKNGSGAAAAAAAQNITTGSSSSQLAATALPDVKPPTVAAPPVPVTAAATPPTPPSEASTASLAAGQGSKQPQGPRALDAPADVQAAAQACKEDPGAADACRVVTKFISEHLEMIESQALEMMKHNERLEKRMQVLEQHTQDYDQDIMHALAESLQMTVEEEEQQAQQVPTSSATIPVPAAVPVVASAAAAAAHTPTGVTTTAADPSSSGSSAADAAGPTDASELVRSFMANFGSSSMLYEGQRSTHSQQQAPDDDLSSGSIDRQLASVDEPATVLQVAAAAADLDVGNEVALEPQYQEVAVAEVTAEAEAEVAAEAEAEAAEAEAESEEHWLPVQDEAAADSVSADAWMNEEDAAAAPVVLQQEDAAETAVEDQLDVEQHVQEALLDDHDMFVAGNGSSAEVFAAALDESVGAFVQPDAAAAFKDLINAGNSTSSSGPTPYKNADPNWQAAHARALQWASHQVEPEYDESEEPEDEEVPWWLKDNLPAARKAPMPIGGGGDRLGVSPSSPTSGGRIKWSRARFTSPAYVMTAEQLQLLQQQQEQSGGDSDREEDAEDGESSRSRLLRRPTAAQSAFSGSAVTLATATPATAAAAAAAAAASPLVQNLQQHAYKAAKAIGQSDQAAAIAATAIASRVAFGCDLEAAAVTISRPPSRRRRQSSTGSNADGTIAGAMAAAIKTRQQVLAVTDLAAQLTAAGDKAGTSGAPELSSAASQGPNSTAGFNPRPESLVPTVSAGPFQLADDVLVLPSAQQIAAATTTNSSGPYDGYNAAMASDGGSTAEGERQEGSNASEGEDDPSDAELQQLATLQQENLMLSQLASLHTRVITLHEQAMALEKEAHADMEAGLTGSSSSSAEDDSSSDDGGDEDSVGGVLGLALKTVKKNNKVSTRSDAAAMKKLMAAVKLRMEAALLQKEASLKRRELNAMRTAAAAASAASFDRHWQQQQQTSVQQQDENSSDGDDDDNDSNSGSGRGSGGGGSSGFEAVPVTAAAAAAAGSAAHMAAATAVPTLASAAVDVPHSVPVTAGATDRGAHQVHALAVAPAAQTMSASPAAVDPCPSAQLPPRIHPAAGAHAAYAVQGTSPEPSSSSSSSRVSAGTRTAPAVAPVLVSAVASSATSNSSSSSASNAAAAMTDAVQQDMQMMKSKIAELQRKVASRKDQIAALASGNAAAVPCASPGGAPTLALGLPAPTVEGPSSAASILGAAAAAAAATAVAAAVPVVVTTPATPTVIQQQAAAAAAMASEVQGSSAVNSKVLPTVKAVVAAGGAAVTAAVTAAASSPKGALFASRVLRSPALVGSPAPYTSIYDTTTSSDGQDKLSQLKARTAAAVANREHISKQALEAQQALAAISSSRQAVAAASAAAAGSAPAISQQGVAAAARPSSKTPQVPAAHIAADGSALETLDSQAATARESLEALERQAAEALAELEAYEASRRHGQLLRQQLMQQHQQQRQAGWLPQQPRQQLSYAATPCSSGSSGPAAVAPVMASGGSAGAGGYVDLEVCDVLHKVPDPAAVAVITGLAAVNVLQQAGHVLHGRWHM